MTSAHILTAFWPAAALIRPPLSSCQGNLHSLAGSGKSPFRASRFWTAHVAQRALLRTAREIASAMRALHATGLVHGALRPTNVLLSRSEADRRGFVARVADVGSQSLAYAASNPMASGPCMLFLAPEALQEEAAECTREADVYAFGMLLYEMAAGEQPFQGQHLGERLGVPCQCGLRGTGLRHRQDPCQIHNRRLRRCSFIKRRLQASCLARAPLLFLSSFVDHHANNVFRPRETTAAQAK